MKKCCILLFLVCFLLGCTSPKDFETMSDVYQISQLPQAAKMSVVLPEDALVMVMEETSGRIYLCDGYCVMLQTLPAGDLNATLVSVTGHRREELPIMELEQGGMTRYECVWAAVGEEGDQVGRLLLLDDGSYHYALTVLSDAQRAGELADAVQSVFQSLNLERQDEDFDNEDSTIP